MRHPCFVLALCLMLSNCGGGDDSPAGPTNPPGSGLPEPNPANVTITMDPSYTSSARVTTNGGTVQATGADGTVYTLSIPADGLVSDTTITMTPISAVAGLEVSGGRFVGVQLEPEGLRFFQPATLRVTPPEGARQAAVGFSYHGNGSEVYRVPLTPDPDLLELHLFHFSGAFIYLGNNTFLAPVNDIMPTDPEDRIQSMLEPFVQEQRKHALLGEETDPSLGERIQKALRQYYHEAIEPTLAQMQTDCGDARTAMPRAMSWVRQIQLFTLGDEFAAESQAVLNAAVNALKNCFDQGKKDCIDTSDPVLMNELTGITRQLEMLGSLDDAHNALNPELQCNKGWSGTTSRTRKLNGDALTDVILGEVQWEIDSANTHPDIVTQYRIKRGTIHWEQKGTDESGCTHDGGPLSFDLEPGDGVMVFDEINNTYQATGIASHFTRVTVTCPDQPSYISDVAVGDWLVTPVLPLTDTTKTLSGTWAYPMPENVYVWQFVR